MKLLKGYLWHKEEKKLKESDEMGKLKDDVDELKDMMKLILSKLDK